MSSSNRVRINAIPETTYGVTPGVGNFKTYRPTSDSLNGNVETTESQQIRSDRQPPGQVATGLTVGGDLNVELCKELELEYLMRSAMFNDWATFLAVTVDLEIDATAKTLERASGTWPVTLKVGDFIKLAGFANSVNNVAIQVMEIVSTTVVRFSGASTIIDEVGPTGLTSFQQCDKLEVGTTQYSLSVMKAFLDLTDKAINYRGEIVNQMAINIAYGEIVTASFSFLGNDYEPTDVAADWMTFGRTIDDPATTLPFNGSIDMPFFATNSDGTFEQSIFCTQSLELTLNNNATPQNCIGRAAPQAYTPGSATLEISLGAYLSDDNWNFLSKKVDQSSFSIGFQLKNADGGYGFYIPAIQVSFDDPAAAGPNQDIVLTMSGRAKVGPNQEKVLYIYRFV